MVIKCSNDASFLANVLTVRSEGERGLERGKERGKDDVKLPFTSCQGILIGTIIICIIDLLLLVTQYSSKLYSFETDILDTLANFNCMKTPIPLKYVHLL